MDWGDKNMRSMRSKTYVLIRRGYVVQACSVLVRAVLRLASQYIQRRNEQTLQDVASWYEQCYVLVRAVSTFGRSVVAAKPY